MAQYTIVQCVRFLDDQVCGGFLIYDSGVTFCEKCRTVQVIREEE